MFGREPVEAWKRSGFYDPVFRNPSWWSDPDAIPLDDESGLGADTANMFKRFLELRWYHVIVKAFAFPYFKNDLAPVADHFAVLPYECLCDGLETQDESEHKHHRHMILAVQKKYVKRFKQIWGNKIRSPDHWNHRGKVLKQIRDAHHLASTIRYVGQRQSTCDGKKLNETSEGRCSHYWLNRPVYPHGILGMCTLYPGGLREYVLVRNRSKLVLPWKDITELNPQRKYVVPISVLDMAVRYCVVPVRRDLQPWAILEQGREEHPFKLWMYETGKCLVFKSNPELQNLSKDEWYRTHAEGGNCFCASIVNDWYELTFAQQKTMRQLKALEKKLQRRLKNVEKEKLNLKREVERVKLNAEYESENAKQRMLDLMQENSVLFQENERMKEENKKMTQLLFEDDDDDTAEDK
ncbi:hypothetical protein AVEN_261824-1 [Araneus ventricosus]|uniref:Uncharacterized protein n=1 Tax=Araneus ventricosus TaxID=182803 RepID=A0A4Y2LZI2_ARAVE|nr:hypothetical protein AVEN_261824-1 [Araneus ventricosus]